MRIDDAHSAYASDRTQASTHHRGFRQKSYGHIPTRKRWNIGSPHRFNSLDPAASASAVNQTNHWQAQITRQTFSVRCFIADCAIRRAAAHREIIAADYDFAPFDVTRAKDEI